MILGAVETQVREVELTGKHNHLLKAPTQVSSTRKAFLSAASITEGHPPSLETWGELEGNTAQQSRGRVPAHLPQHSEVNRFPARWLQCLLSSNLLN